MEGLAGDRPLASRTFNLDVTHQLEQMRSYEDSWGDLLPPSRYVASDSDNT